MAKAAKTTTASTRVMVTAGNVFADDGVKLYQFDVVDIPNAETAKLLVGRKMARVTKDDPTVEISDVQGKPSRVEL